MMRCSEAPRHLSMCAHVVASTGKGLFEVADTRLDPRFADHPLVSSGPGMRFYAGTSLKILNQHSIKETIKQSNKRTNT